MVESSVEEVAEAAMNNVDFFRGIGTSFHGRAGRFHLLHEVQAFVEVPIAASTEASEIRRVLAQTPMYV